MEESKEIKRKKTFRLIVKIFNILLLSMISLFLICLMFYVISSKIAEKKEKTPLFGFYTIISPSMEPNINVYDVVLVKKTNINKLKKGDVITFYSTNNYFGDTPITHRIANIDDRTSIIVKGDHNEKADNEKVIPKNIIGKVILVIPSLGKLQFFLASKSGFIIAIIIPAIVIITYDVYKIMKMIMLKNQMSKLKNKNGNI
ncbi:signal peptidase I [Clostridium sp. CAG:1000]|jgi:signal peptidase|nr:signal peptidase I [Clostridium sp. CAG:1000]